MSSMSMPARRKQSASRAHSITLDSRAHLVCSMSVTKAHRWTAQKGLGFFFFVAHGLDAGPGRQHTGQPAIGWACGPAGPPVTFLNLSENGHMISRPETRDYGND